MSLLFFKKLYIYTLSERKIWTTKLIMGKYFLRLINQKIFNSIKCLLYLALIFFTEKAKLKKLFSKISVFHPLYNSIHTAQSLLRKMQ